MASIARLTGVLLAGLLSVGCQPPESASAPPPHAPYRGPLASSLQVEPMGDSARLVLQVTNGGEVPVTIGFSSGQGYDFVVRDGAAEVWRWSTGMAFTQALRSETLAPGETRSYAEVWRGSAPYRGRTLTAEARLTSRDHPLERTAEFRVP